ncbi:MAG: 16S rRNA (guanine(966)-N(2))-methyltransferase RsmD [Candidatus Margulisbacteria bacterium]|nr:16S rRNA (guanine(966)-N(2))-methyltransferase RsmD [Candidatus Margulisiibacteriota bacterium]MBU1021498.1 16S rRNA (guanine(966)-N(2))-methyltransferase RsmD [Candidatus Margulisiibacteriota bacterium]MBU1728583.1 16S rRNA (guanine(966)-N(2))-methyltransferase RsmD [Candidatus Margulisiibacteriota bacterium]MBU1955838.1 16S rRNA (guanine(966)-N(2))-methyltransferase RsmD [Candidatus Margulisiibacteriota bacterium]
MRVIAGEAKGRKLKAPAHGVRPLTDRAKETLFNILNPNIEDANFLDLFAGSGSVGIEALSRGAKLSFFVEKSRDVVKFIYANLGSTGLRDRAEVFLLDVRRAIKILDSKGAKFDIIYVGAPYGSKDFVPSLELLGNSSLLHSKAIVVAEHRSRDAIPENINKLSKYREKKLGDTTLSFYKVEST